MKKIISLLLVVMLTTNLIQVNNISYAKELGTNEETITEADTEATSSVESEDFVISGTNAIGSMLENELTEVTETQEQNNGYNVFAVEVEGTVATVEYEATEDCQLLVSIYDNEGVQMLGSGEVDVLATETEATVTIDIDTMPTYFYIRVYMIEKDTLVPLCQEYNSELYTQTMQEFLAKTPEDFDTEKVLEIEEESNSFVVFSETTQIIPYNADYNTIEQIDETNKEYVIANPDENFSTLEIGDIFSYEYEDGQVLIVDIATIENQDGKLVITGNEADMNEVFDYVRIDTDFSTGDYIVDPSTCDEDVTYLGRTNEDEQVDVASVKSTGKNTTIGGFEILGVEKQASSGDKIEIGDSYEVGKKDSKGNPQGFYGSLEFKVTGEIKVYRATGTEYMEMKLTITIDGTVEFTEKIDKSLKLGHIGFSPVAGVYIEFVPQIKFTADAAVKYEAKVTYEIGVKGDRNGIKNITKQPKIEHKLGGEGTVYIGFSLSPKLKVVNDNLFKISLTATAGVEFKLDEQDIITNEAKGIKHDCVVCFEGDVKFKLELSANLQLCGVDWFKYTKNFAKIDKKISDLYASPTHREFGLTKCPHLKYRITAMAVDANKSPLEGVTICDKYKTNADGMVEFYLKRGKYQATAKKNGYNYALSGMIINRFEVKNKERQLYFIMLPGEITIGRDVFPDDKFRQYVKDKIDTDGNGKLSQLEIMAVTEIDVSDSNISDLSGVEIFTQLQELHCNSNALTSLDVSKNTQLQYLCCYSSFLTSLDVSKNTQLQYLHCDSNALTSLDVSKNTQLQYLYCNSNALTSLDVSKNTQLQGLFCESNVLTSLDVSKNTQLQELHCNTNALTSLDISKNTQLQELLCHSNVLTSLDVSKNTQLQRLACSSNVLTGLDISKNTQLQYLFCDSNALTSLDVSKNTQLQYLSCDSNALTSLDVSKNTQLQYLFCDSNALTSLDVSKNTQLQSLGCYSNFLTSLDVSKNIQLEFLTCNYNDMKRLDLTNNTKLIYYDCDDDVEVIGYNTTSANVALANESKEILEPKANTTSVDSNNDENVSSEQLQEKNWIVSTATDTQNSYSGLYPKETYNFYVFKDAPTDIPFDSVFAGNNLLYVKQYTADTNGSLTLDYTPAGDNMNTIEILVCARKIDIADGYEVFVDDLTYNGEKQIPKVILCVQGKTLVQGKDFNIEGDVIVSEVGDYSLTLAGAGKYTGELKVTFSVVSEKAVLVTGIVLNQPELKLFVGDKAVLSATIAPSDASDASLVWVSSNPSVVTVDSMGNVTAIAEGTANVIVMAADGSGAEVQCAVTVAKKQEPSTQQPQEDNPSADNPLVDNPSADDPTTEQPPTASEPDETKELPKVGSKKTVSSGQYKVTKSSSKSKEVAFLKPKSSKKTSVSIPSTIKINGYTYKVTEISSKAFKNNKKLESVTIGKNVKKIGKEAFYNCKKLKKITIKSTVLQSVGKNAIKNIDKKATIKVPKKQLRKYEKLFKSKTGYKKTMKIKK